MDERFDALVRASLPELLRFGVAVSGNSHDGADLVQGALEATSRRWRKVGVRDDAIAYVKAGDGERSHQSVAASTQGMVER